MTLVANSDMRIPSGDRIKLVVVDKGLNEADEWITDHVEKDDIVINGDIPMAAHCLDRWARALGHKGKPFSMKDRSLFLQQLDQMVNAIKRD